MARARWQVDLEQGAGRRRGVRDDRRDQVQDMRHGLTPQVRVRAQTLGAAVLLIGQERLDPSADTMFAVLLRVLFSPGLRVTRDEVVRAVWQEQPERRQRANLRQALYKLRRMGVTVGLDGDVVVLDAAQVTPAFATHRTPERFEQDVTLGHEPFGLFLAGYTTGWSAYDEWLSQLREGVHADVRRVLVEQLRARRTRADWMGADALARWLLQFDPLNEEATVTCAECAALNGSKVEAVAMLDRYLAEVGPDAGDLRLQATLLRRRITEPQGKQRVSFAPTERHFIGREELMAELTLAMRRAKWHDGSATLLHGPPGMGKTRVTQELSKVAVLEGFRVVTVNCRESDQQRPLSVFLDLVPELLEMPGAMGCSPESMEVLRRLTELVLSDASKAADVQEASSSLREVTLLHQSSIRRSVLDVLAAVSHEHPILFVLEDAQWLDISSSDVLLDLTEQIGTTRTYVLVTSHRLFSSVSLRGQTSRRLSSRRIERLSDEKSYSLAQAIAQDFSAKPTTELLDWFVRASEGCPLFLRHLVHHWIETGDAGGIPPTLSGALSQRVFEMSVEARRVLEVVSLMRPFATVELIRDVLEISLADVITALSELRERAALNDASHVTIAMHDLLATTVEEEMSSLIRTTLRKHIAKAHSRHFETSGETEHLFAAMRHLVAAGDRSESARFIRSHLQVLVAAGRPTEVLNALSGTTEGVLGSDLADTAIRSAIRRLELEAGEYGRAASLWTHGLELAPANGLLSDAQADDCLSHVDSAYRADAFADPQQLTRYCVEVSSLRTISPRVRARACEIGLIIASNTCDEGGAKTLFAHLESIGDAEAVASSTRASLVFHTLFGSRDLASRSALSCKASAESLGDSSIKYTELCRAGFALRITSSPEVSETSFKAGFEVAQRLGSPRMSQYPCWQLATMLRDRGELAAAAEWESRLFSLVSDDDDRHASNFITGHACRIAIDAEDARSAQIHLKEYEANLPRLAASRAIAFLDALRLGSLLIDRNRIPDANFLAAAEARHAEIARFGTSDFLTAVVTEAKFRVQGLTEARDFANNYMLRLRREISAPSVRLERWLREVNS